MLQNTSLPFYLLSPLFFLLTFLLLTGCSTSDNGAVLPEQSIDSEEPMVRFTKPPELEGNLLARNTEFKIHFDELLDAQSVLSGISLYARKQRNIMETLALDSDGVIFNDSDARSLSVSLLEEVYTKSREVLVSETVDDEGNLQRDVRFIPEEVDATVVEISPYPTLALASLYTLSLGSELKDISPISSISPVDGSATSGNFMNARTLSFGTVDGQWQSWKPVNDAFWLAGDSVVSSKFISSAQVGGVAWIQSDASAGGAQQLYLRRFDQAAQNLSLENHRLDLDFVLNEDVATSGDVIDFDVIGSQDHFCTAWVASSSSADVILRARCGDENTLGGRLDLASHGLQSAIDNLSINIATEDRVMVSYSFDEQYFVYLLQKNQSNQVVLIDSIVIEFGQAQVSDVATGFWESEESTKLHVLFSIFDSSAMSAEQSSLLHYTIGETDLNNLGITSTLIERGQSVFEQLSVGFDSMGRGLAGWVKGSGSNRLFYTARYDTRSWKSAIPVIKDGRGSVTEGVSFVYEDGQALMAWVESLNGTHSLQVQGSFPADGGVGFIRPPIKKLKQNGAFGSLDLIGDREGNGFVFYSTGTSVEAIRFNHNVAWDDAWKAEERVSVTDGQFYVAPIMEDGRIAFLYSDSEENYSALQLRLFSDFD